MKVIRMKRHEKVDPHSILDFSITAAVTSVSIIRPLVQRAKPSPARARESLADVYLVPTCMNFQ